MLSVVEVVRLAMRTAGRDMDHWRASKKNTALCALLGIVAFVAWVALSLSLAEAFAQSPWGNGTPELDDAAIACLDEEIDCPEPALFPAILFAFGFMISMLGTVGLVHTAPPRPRPHHTAKMIAVMSTWGTMAYGLLVTG